ncbi:MAG: hypothetical protein HYX67_08100 [Candidatus Melainabacteria bacterium]|nr:hypothetical protein [Candidatus Melainabacteria bacterium]
MLSRFLLSLTAFTLVGTSYSFADDPIAQDEFIEEELDALDEEIADIEEQPVQENLYFTGEWLFWRTREEGTEFAPTRNLNFDFESGYRVGLGVHLPTDFWDIYVSYTDFRPDHSASAHGSFTPLFLFNVGNVTEGHAHWGIKYQNVDVEIGRSYYLA